MSIEKPEFKMFQKVTAKPYFSEGVVILITDDFVSVEVKNPSWSAMSFAPYAEYFRFYFDNDPPQRGSLGEIMPLPISKLQPSTP